MHPQQPQQPQQIMIPLDQLKPVKCACGGEHFEATFSLKLAPALLTGQPTDTLVNVQHWRCIRCGEYDQLDYILAQKKAEEESKGLTLVK